MCKTGTEQFFNCHKIRIVSFNISKTKDLILMHHMSISLGTLSVHDRSLPRRLHILNDPTQNFTKQAGQNLAGGKLDKMQQF